MSNIDLATLILKKQAIDESPDLSSDRLYYHVVRQAGATQPKGNHFRRIDHGDKILLAWVGGMVVGALIMYLATLVQSGGAV